VLRGAMTVHLERIELAPALIVFGAGTCPSRWRRSRRAAGSTSPWWTRGPTGRFRNVPDVTLEVRDPDAFARDST